MSRSWLDIKHFKPVEFDSPDERGSGSKMDLDFVSKLDAIRDIVGYPLIINSGYRTEAHNASLVHGVNSSAHTSGHAADIRALSASSKFNIICAAMRIGFRRIGFGFTFIHLDDDSAKPQDLVWIYPEARES